MHSILGLLGFLGANFAAAMSGAMFPPGAWYEGLRKPSWNPPNWAFPVVWTILFVMMAFSGWLVWREVGFGLPIAVYGVQLVLNAAWSWLFFGLRRPDLAFAELVVFWLAILATILLFAPIHAGAAWLLVPYIAWVTTAGVLNWQLWRMNPVRA